MPERTPGRSRLRGSLTPGRSRLRGSLPSTHGQSPEIGHTPGRSRLRGSLRGTHQQSQEIGSSFSPFKGPARGITAEPPESRQQGKIEEKTPASELHALQMLQQAPRFSDLARASSSAGSPRQASVAKAPRKRKRREHSPSLLSRLCSPEISRKRCRWHAGSTIRSPSPPRRPARRVRLKSPEIRRSPTRSRAVASPQVAQPRRDSDRIRYQYELRAWSPERIAEQEKKRSEAELRVQMKEEEEEEKRRAKEKEEQSRVKRTSLEGQQAEAAAVVACSREESTVDSDNEVNMETAGQGMSDSNNRGCLHEKGIESAAVEECACTNEEESAVESSWRGGHDCEKRTETPVIPGTAEIEQGACNNEERRAKGTTLEAQKAEAVVSMHETGMEIGEMVPCSPTEVASPIFAEDDHEESAVESENAAPDDEEDVELEVPTEIASPNIAEDDHEEHVEFDVYPEIASPSIAEDACINGESAVERENAAPEDEEDVESEVPTEIASPTITEDDHEEHVESGVTTEIVSPSVADDACINKESAEESEYAALDDEEDVNILSPTEIASPTEDDHEEDVELEVTTEIASPSIAGDACINEERAVESSRRGGHDREKRIETPVIPGTAEIEQGLDHHLKGTKSCINEGWQVKGTSLKDHQAEETGEMSTCSAGDRGCPHERLRERAAVEEGACIQEENCWDSASEALDHEEEAELELSTEAYDDSAEEDTCDMMSLREPIEGSLQSTTDNESEGLCHNEGMPDTAMQSEACHFPDIAKGTCEREWDEDDNLSDVERHLFGEEGDAKQDSITQEAEKKEEKKVFDPWAASRQVSQVCARDANCAASLFEASVSPSAAPALKALTDEVRSLLAQLSASVTDFREGQVMIGDYWKDGAWDLEALREDVEAERHNRLLVESESEDEMSEYNCDADPAVASTRQMVLSTFDSPLSAAYSIESSAERLMSSSPEYPIFGREQVEPLRLSFGLPYQS